VPTWKKDRPLLKQAQTSQDPYFLALVANACSTAARPIPRRTCSRELATLQKKEGPADRHADEHHRLGGRTLEIETTALAGWPGPRAIGRRTSTST